MPSGGIFIGKYRLREIRIPIDGEGPTELNLMPDEETRQDISKKKYVLISHEQPGVPLILRVEDIRILQMLKIGELYYVTFQQAA